MDQLRGARGGRPGRGYPRGGAPRVLALPTERAAAVTTPSERQHLVLDVLAGCPAEDVAARAGVEPELLRRWVALFVEGGALRLAGRLDPSSFEARDRFLVLVAHEFRTPLAVIRGWVETLQAGGLSAEVHDDALAVVARQVDHLERIARDAIDAGAVAQGRLRLAVGPLDLRAAVARVAAATASPADALVEVEAGPPAVVEADADRVEQVSADVLAHARRLVVDAPVRVRFDAGDEQVTVTVEATGRPLSFEEASELFEPYGRSDTSVGTGLGLYVCRALLAAHGGEIGLRSSGATSQFWFRLPRVGPPGAAHDEESR